MISKEAQDVWLKMKLRYISYVVADSVEARAIDIGCWLNWLKQEAEQ